MKSLAQLLPEYAAQSSLMVSGISHDSRQVKPGQLFFAYTGYGSDGRDYIPQAIANGATVVVYDADNAGGITLEAFPDVLLIPATQIRDLLADVAARFFDHPSKNMTVIAVTGTNGKTSITHFIAQVLAQQKIACAVLGSLGNGLLSQLQTTANTTMGAIDLQQALWQFQRQGVTHVAMEASSHALDQSRLGGLHLDTAVFSQLSRDHLDYHGSMSAYRQAKEKLFRHSGLSRAVINRDDAWGRELIHRYQRHLAIIDYGFSEHPPLCERFVRGKLLSATETGYKMQIQSNVGSADFFCPLLGKFNMSNVLAVIAVLLQQDMCLDTALVACSHLQGIAGRMQCLGGGTRPQVVVDYAHTPDALSHVLQSLRERCSGKLWCVFGCGGERDVGKRADMGQVAEKLADHVVITTDNPRNEAPKLIIQAILAGCASKHLVSVIMDRGQAIDTVVQSAAADDMILVAGKGHETVQVVGSRHLPFSDIERVLAALGKRSAPLT